ncbi:MAG: cell surface receptor domain protein [Deltaproteobacteria bacterium]|nr:cell surface receptor domain protein [Deltaproteobacteria bacterium]
MRATLVLSALSLSMFGALSCGGNNNGDDQPLPECSDTIDNDGDGTTDFPDDLGCTSAIDETEDSPTMPQCNDGRDNDGDGKADYPADPGCFAPQADGEEDDCPTGPNCPQCGNGQDDDMNSATDYPSDPGCESAADTSEFLNNPIACGVGLKIKQLPPSGTDMGMLDSSSTSMVTSPCGGGGGAPAIAYIFNLSKPKVLVASTDNPDTVADTVIDVRKADCMNPDSGLVCSDDIDANNTSSSVTQALDAGTYYLIVEGHDSSSLGAFTLDAHLFNGVGTECTDQAECGPGLTCRIPVGQTLMVCAKPPCSDGIDDDADGKTDYPNDPGCGTPEGTTEVDDCPSGPNCPECANGADDDLDTTTDYPADLTCKAAGDASEACPTSEGVQLLTEPVTTGTTVGATDDSHPTCGSQTSLAPDRTYRLDLPPTTTLSISTTGISIVKTLLNSTCAGTPINCSTATTQTVANLAAGTYYFVADGSFTTSAGAYTINLSGTIANAASCEGALAVSGALKCGAGFACKGTAGARTCQVAQCNDNIDNNSNGKKDFPNDPGCLSSSDDTETNVCPGANCPVCSNGIDDDMDGKTDFPLDVSCVAASGSSESCTASEGVATLTMPTTAGDTSTATDDVKLACASTTSVGKDLTYKLDVPALTTLKFVLTNSFDAATAVFSSTCLAPAVACSDPNTLTLNTVAAGTYFYVVDGFSTGSGPFTVAVSGTIATNASCESALAQSGALTCATGFACKGTAGARTCKPAACSDGIDNNSNGKIDYPNDPGCSSGADDTEVTVCPGVNCPVCSNGLDDDTDTFLDYPADFGCAAAGAMSEVFCTGEPDFGGAITTAVTTGTLAGGADNYDQTCQTNTGNDTALALQLPVPVASLQIDTIGSTISDTVVSLKDAACGTQLGCDDDSDPNSLRSLLTVTNVPAGNYAIQVDSFGTSNNGAFTLNVKGTVAAQTACTSPLFAAGVLVCPTGTTCTANKCQ